MITPEQRKQIDEEEDLKDIVRKGIDLRMSGQIDRERAKRYWLGHLPNLPLEVVADVLAIHLPTIQHIEHSLMKELLKQRR